MSLPATGSLACLTRGSHPSRSGISACHVCRFLRPAADIWHSPLSKYDDTNGVAALVPTWYVYDPFVPSTDVEPLVQYERNVAHHRLFLRVAPLPPGRHELRDSFQLRVSDRRQFLRMAGAARELAPPEASQPLYGCRQSSRGQCLRDRPVRWVFMLAHTISIS